MLDTADFYRQMGAEQALQDDEQLLLPGSVRLHCSEQTWTVVFEDLRIAEGELRELFLAARHWPELVPFLTGGGQAALRWRDGSPLPQNARALQCLRAVLRHMGALSS